VQDGRIVGTQSALRDITERKQIEAQYLQAQKMESIGRLAGGVAHDFNNLLQVINGYADLLLEGRPDDKQYRADLEAIRLAGERAADLTRNLLTFSRKEQAKPTVLDLNDVVADAGRMLVRMIGEDIELITRLSPTPGFVIADSNQAHQILMNLTVNARDAMPHGGRIVIETKNVEPDEDFVRRHPDFERISWVYLGFTDTGSGMSEDVKRHLFEPFFTTKSPGKGTGLGLATIYGIVQQSSGRIEVTSRPDEGTTFHLFLPRTTSEGLPANAPKTGPVIRGSETVLVVEDQEAVRQYLRTVLERSGYRVLEAGNGPDALALVNRFDQTIHLIVTDLVMPLMNGRDLTEKLKITRPGTKVLFISGYANETIDDRGIDKPDLVYLQKPFDSEQLIAKVQEALRYSDSLPGNTMRFGA
jgi:two-component system cell cycle sensor histidine kinase/response regulator CckA